MRRPASAVRAAALLAAAPLVVSCLASGTPTGPASAPSPAAPSTAAPPPAAPSTAAPSTMRLTSSGAGDLVRVRLRRAVRNLDVARETRRGYDRDRFQHWVDADGDCQDTRDEVLDAESRIEVSGCDIQSGTWRSRYDGVVVRDSSELDIDHLVPLAEAWDSGARRWTSGTRKRFANDLRDRRSLVAVTASSNRSKSDQDPSEWLPSRAVCGYVRSWVAVKIRWSLRVDRPEKRELVSLAADCTNRVVEVRKARVRRAGSGTTTVGDSDPKFGSCSEAIAAGYGPYVQGEDEEYGWYTDGDGDGVVCES